MGALISFVLIICDNWIHFQLQLSGLEMSTNSTGDDQFKTIQLQTPSPRTFTEPIRRMPAESSSGGNNMVILIANNWSCIDVYFVKAVNSNV